MNYTYTAKSPEEIKALAAKIRAEHGARVDGYVFDVEAVIEDLGMTILPRPLGSVSGVEGYAAADPKIIVVNEYIMLNAPRARFTLAEELAHRILESGIWGESVPKRINPEEMDPDQYRALEKDAKALGVELLQPEQQYRELFHHHTSALGIEKPNAPEGWILRNAILFISGEFHVGFLTAMIRGRELELLTPAQLREYFYPQI